VGPPREAGSGRPERDARPLVESHWWRGRVARRCCGAHRAAPEFGWLNKGVVIGVGGRKPGGVIYETYLVW